jgi:hypothetical protein
MTPIKFKNPNKYRNPKTLRKLQDIPLNDIEDEYLICETTADMIYMMEEYLSIFDEELEKMEGFGVPVDYQITDQTFYDLREIERKLSNLQKRVTAAIWE